MEQTYSLQEILKIIKKRLILIFCITIIGIGLAVTISYYYLTPTYQVQTQILVNQKVDSQEVISNSNDIDLKLINTYKGILTSSAILNKVIEKLELDISPEELKGKINVSNEDNSKIVNIIVTHENHHEAVEVANTLAEIFEKEIPLLMNVDNVNILSQAEYTQNTSPIKPNKKLNVIIGTFAGVILGVGLALLLEVLDTRIKDEKDVETILNIPIMGVVGIIQPEKR